MIDPYTNYLRALYRQWLPTAGRCIKASGTLLNFRPPADLVEMAWLEAVRTGHGDTGACILESNGQRFAVVPWPETK